IIDGENIGRKISNELDTESDTDNGSIISIIATDIPLSSRQLKRVCKRVGVGLSRIGSFIGHRSGEVTIAFSTANTIKHKEKKEIVNMKLLNEDKIDIVFR